MHLLHRDEFLYTTLNLVALLYVGSDLIYIKVCAKSRTGCQFIQEHNAVGTPPQKSPFLIYLIQLSLLSQHTYRLLSSLVFACFHRQSECAELMFVFYSESYPVRGYHDDDNKFLCWGRHKNECFVGHVTHKRIPTSAS